MPVAFSTDLVSIDVVSFLCELPQSTDIPVLPKRCGFVHGFIQTGHYDLKSPQGALLNLKNYSLKSHNVVSG